jgi:hypothetical protein
MRPKKTVYSNTEIPGRIHAMQPFLSEGRLPDGTRRWSGHSGPAVTLGLLPRRWHRQVREAVYVVYSYDTPIAWVREAPQNGPRNPYWYTVPDVGYSPTTGQHQMACMDAWADQMRSQGTYRRLPSRGREIVRVPGNAEVYGQERRLRAGGMDGHLPDSDDRFRTNHRGVRYDSRVERDTSYERDMAEERRSAYEGVSGDAMHYTPSAVHLDGHERSHP